MFLIYQSLHKGIFVEGRKKPGKLGDQSSLTDRGNSFCLFAIRYYFSNKLSLV